MNKRLQLYIVLILLFAGCISEKKEKKLLQWVKKNERLIEGQFEKRIEEITVSLDENWVVQSFVITENDSTVLGELAKIAKSINNCYIIEFVFDKNRYKKRKIKITNDDDCDKKDLQTKYIYLKNLILEVPSFF